MKKVIIAVALIAISLSSKASSTDTIPVRRGFVLVKYNKWGPFHKVRCTYIIKQEGYYTDRYFVNGRELRLARKVTDSTSLAFK